MATEGFERGYNGFIIVTMRDGFTFLTILLIGEFQMRFEGDLKLFMGDECHVYCRKVGLKRDIRHSEGWLFSCE